MLGGVDLNRKHGETVLIFSGRKKQKVNCLVRRAFELTKGMRSCVTTLCPTSHHLRRLLIRRNQLDFHPTSRLRSPASRWSAASSFSFWKNTIHSFVFTQCNRSCLVLPGSCSTSSRRLST